MEDSNKNEYEMFDLIRGWAITRGLYQTGDVKTQFVKLQEEAGEVARAIIKNDKASLEDGIGDMVVVLTNLAHLAGTSIEVCVSKAWNEIKDRQGSMQNGSFVKADKKERLFKCLSTEEIKRTSWSRSFTVGSTYKEAYDKGIGYLSEMESDSILLESDSGTTYYVDKCNFKRI